MIKSGYSKMALLTSSSSSRVLRRRESHPGQKISTQILRHGFEPWTESSLGSPQVPRARLTRFCHCARLGHILSPGYKANFNESSLSSSHDEVARTFSEQPIAAEGFVYTKMTGLPMRRVSSRKKNLSRRFVKRGMQNVNARKLIVQHMKRWTLV